MNDRQRTYLGDPLVRLWDGEGEFGECFREVLSEEDIVTMLREGPTKFVEADVGMPLRWIAEDECFEFWKSVRANLHVREKPYMEDYPNCFFYRASEWIGRDDDRVIVLAKNH